MSFAKMDGNFINQTVRAMKILRDFTAEMMKRRRESPRFFTFPQHSSAQSPRFGGETL